MEITCGKQVTQPLVHSVTYGSNIDGVYSENYITSLEGQLMSETFHSNFCFDIDKKIVVPNLFRSDHDGANVMNISLSSISCFDGRRCIVAPNGEQVVLIYDEYGNEISRAFINISIYSIAGGILGHPLMIENGTSMIYEYSNGAIRQLFWSQPLLPFDIASLNDGRIVLVGTMNVRSLQGVDVETEGAMRIYEQNGLLCNEVAKENGEPLFKFPRQVCVNLHNNDIYVGDIRKMQVMRFREDCTFVSLYRRREMESIDLGNGVISELIIRSSNFPLALTYSQRSHLLFASYVSAIDRGIHVLSPGLELLGIFSSNEELGNPVGMSCDENGRLYVGDTADGIIRVFKLSQFINRL
ncbi:hypothetical protein FSP39_011144 [Pinctada imbricata]|uniref:Uncharacterized protein n=1 Tax=Pinctada imbricata TaxID=66713 RepID=A0AA89BUG4_PINIB|nr:hypothetical protein FSP39_011144 [Pinctada imbricata]